MIITRWNKTALRDEFVSIPGLVHVHDRFIVVQPVRNDVAFHEREGWRKA